MYLVGTAVAGVLGNQTDAAFTGAFRAIHRRLREGGAPVNHDLQRAVRRAVLEATLVACAAYERETKGTKDPWPRDARKWLDRQLRELPKADYIPPGPGVDSEVSLLLQPARGYAEDRVPQLRERLEQAMLDELRERLSAVPDRFERLLREGWQEPTEEGASVPLTWFDLVCDYFVHQLKTEPRVQAIFQGEILAALATEIPGMFLTLGQLEKGFERHAAVITSELREILAQISALRHAFGDYLQAPTQLASIIRAREFQALVEDRTKNFVGRDYVFAAIDQKIGDEGFPSGYVVVQGEPGIGKTAVMAQMVKQRGYVHHFNIAPQGIRSAQAFLANICAQLIVRYELDHAALPAEATKDSGFLSQLLDEAAKVPDNLPLVVLVDALDEAEDEGLPPDANRLYLPPSLPSGVYFVVSTREKYDHRLVVHARRDIYLREDDPDNLEDIQKYIRRSLGPGMAEINERWGVNEGDFVRLLTDRSEGNFMYLRHIVADIRDGSLPAGALDKVLPRGLRDYYQRHWRAMRSTDPQHFEQYQEPVVCLLATAREPVNLAQLLEWTMTFWSRRGWDPGSVVQRKVRDVITEWREFLNVDTTAGDERYRVYHASFQDFLREEVGLTVYHETISTSALAKIPGFLAGG